jgi:hypothetical protein
LHDVHVPQEFLPGDLIAGARFNAQTSLCLTEEENRQRSRLVYGKGGARERMKWFHDHGYGNSGATSGHLIPGHENALKKGWKGIYEEIKSCCDALGNDGKDIGRKAQLRAMMTAATMPRELAKKILDPHPAIGRKRNRQGEESRPCPNGEKPGQGSVGACRDILGGCPGTLAQPHVDNER